MPSDDETKKDQSDQFPTRLKHAREVLRKWNQIELGTKAGMPPSSIAHFEAGARKPSFDTLRRLASALDVTTDYLLGRVDSPNVAESGDPLFRDVANLTGHDRELAQDFVKMLAQRRQFKQDGDT